MTFHLEMRSSSGPQQVALTGRRLTIGKLDSCTLSLAHDPTVSRMHALLENYGSAWSIRDLGSRNGTYVNGQKITAERLLRAGDQLRLGTSRLTFCHSTPEPHAGQAPPPKPNQRPQLPSQLPRRERDVLIALCRPIISQDPFPQPATIGHIAAELHVTHAA